ncbi:MAG: 3-hydroxyacyl-ACP dehydratase FabZ [Bacteriovoracaceae bacterium]|nr:3-hydroxyacyl-ACP dehydratase FabZ [Bacteriovoracaceae bacterium]
MENVEDLIPQRKPFLFVDKIVDRGENTIQTVYKVTGNEDFFKGHFPGNPIMPGVLLQEAIFQTGACLMASKEGDGLGVVTRVQSAKFKGMVKPGDLLEMSVELTDNAANAFYFKGRTKVNDKLVLGLDFACALVKEI